MTLGEGMGSQERGVFWLDPDRPLTRQERVFVRALAQTNNAYRARKEANFKRVSVHDLLGRPAVKKALAEAQQAMMETLPINPYDVLRELAIIAFSDITDFEVLPDGTVRSRCGDPAATRAIMDVKHKMRRKAIPSEEGKPPISETKVETTIKLWSKDEALGLLMKHLGLTDPRTLRAPPRTYVRCEQA
jgi:hypothetical protein